MMMLRVIVLASALAHGKAAPSTSRNLAGRELGNREDCEGTRGNMKKAATKCYEDVTDEILAKGRFEEGSICTRDHNAVFKCTGCLECADPEEDVCEPRANEEHDRVFSSMTTFPYYDTSLHQDGAAEGPCCAWCDNKKHANKAWKRVSDNGDPAKCEWNRFCSGCSECDP